MPLKKQAPGNSLRFFIHINASVGLLSALQIALLEVQKSNKSLAWLQPLLSKVVLHYPYPTPSLPGQPSMFLVQEIVHCQGWSQGEQD